MTGTRGLRLQHRTVDGGGTSLSAQLAPNGTPRWLKLSRNGPVFTAATSTDGSTWQALGSCQVPMGPAAHIGLVACSHDEAQSTTAAFDSVSVAGGAVDWSGWQPGTATVADWNGIGGDAPRTVSMWVRAESAGQLLRWGDVGSGSEWTLRIDDADRPGALRLEVGGGYMLGEASVIDGAWHHVAAVLPPATVGAERLTNHIKLYVDGALQETALCAPAAIATSTTSPLIVGGGGAESAFWGEIDA
ncbi:MAG: LamG-like jellyroll fold domain-containing protein, partial [Planctomycetota bacterium]